MFEDPIIGAIFPEEFRGHRHSVQGIVEPEKVI
jgi:hypothetical protein